MSALQTLIDMGFPEARAKKAISVAGNNVEQAMEWLLAHADDPDVDQQEAAPPATQPRLNLTGGNKSADDKMETETSEGAGASGAGAEGKDEAKDDAKEEEAKSLKCDECGKLFKNSEEVEFHAVKSGHSKFSESTEEKKPLTEEEKKQKLKDIEEKIRARRLEKEKEEAKEALEREKKRISMGQNIADAKRKYQEDEMKRIAEERRREKMEDKIARQKIKEQIERDKLARKEMFANQGGASNSSPAPEVPKPQPASNPTPKKDYTTTRLQIRLPSGSPIVHEFSAKESLSAVRLWISLNRTDGQSSDVPFTIATTFPRKVFTDEDMAKPLDVLGLVPSSVVIVTNKLE